MLRVLSAVGAACLMGQGSAFRHRKTAPGIKDINVDDVSEDVSGHGVWDIGAPQDWTMEDAIRVLWYGYDVGHEIQGFLARAPHRRYYMNKTTLQDSTYDPTKASPGLVVLGPKDSGVSLLMETLELNYWNEMKSACDWDELWVYHDRPWTGHLYCRAWPHGLQVNGTGGKREGTESLYEVMKSTGTDMENTVALMVVKSPLATMQSWNTALRDPEPCISRPARKWDKPCVGRDMSWTEDGSREYLMQLEAKSTMEVYNEYLKMYRQVVKERKFKKAIIITYEDLVEAPAETVLSIANVMNWKPLGDIAVMEGLPVGGYPAPGRPLMVEEMRGRLWLGWTPKPTRDLWCEHLDTQAFDDIAENNYRIEEFPYAQYGFDCSKQALRSSPTDSPAWTEARAR